MFYVVKLVIGQWRRSLFLFLCISSMLSFGKILFFNVLFVTVYGLTVA